MTLLENLLLSLPGIDMPTETVILGARWTMVVSSHCGLAGTPGGPCGTVKSPASDFTGKLLKDLLPMAHSSNPLEARVGIAALNAALAEILKADRFQPYSIPRARGKTVGLVGDFAFTEQLRTLADEVIVVETDLAEQVLPRVDIAIISGSTIVDHSLEGLLKASASCYTIVFGPSTPLSPVLFDYGADQLVGTQVESREATAECIARGIENLMECPGLRPVILRK